MDGIIPSSSSNEWEDEAESYHRAFWLDSVPPPLDDNFLGANGSFQDYPLPQEMPVQDFSLHPKQEPQVSEGNFPSLTIPFGQELNGSCALNALGYPPTQFVGYNQLPEAPQVWASSALPSAIDQDFEFQGQLCGIQHPHLGGASFDYTDTIQETQGFSTGIYQQDGLQNVHRTDLPPQFMYDPNPQPLQAPPTSAIAQNLVLNPRLAVREPFRAAANTNIRRGGRVRARRGQATDPHSIAERLRREKISERMNSLHELIPNATKTDKASMLVAIISYVKFLQIQVKEKSGDGIEEKDQEWNEREEVEKQVLGLLESNVSGAMQLLQSRGLCLMPVSLAAAVAACRGVSSDSKAPLERKRARLADHHGRPVRSRDRPAEEESPYNPDDNSNSTVSDSKPTQ